MGVDACYTNHARADQNAIENLAVLLTAAGCNYFMGVPMGDDAMLAYQCTSYHDTATLRQLFGLRPAPEFEAWLTDLGLMQHGCADRESGRPHVLLTTVTLWMTRNPMPSALICPIRPCPNTAINHACRTPSTLAPCQPSSPPPRLVLAWAALAHATPPPRCYSARVITPTQDTLMRDVDQHVLDDLDLFTVHTKITGGKSEYLLRPDLGRHLSDAAKQIIEAHCLPSPQIQLVVGGLERCCCGNQRACSVTSAQAGGRGHGVERGHTIFHQALPCGGPERHWRGAETRGHHPAHRERPGLGRAASLSAYMAYRPTAGDTDADRDVVSNIFATAAPTRSPAQRASSPWRSR